MEELLLRRNWFNKKNLPFDRMGISQAILNSIYYVY